MTKTNYGIKRKMFTSLILMLVALFALVGSTWAYWDMNIKTESVTNINIGAGVVASNVKIGGNIENADLVGISITPASGTALTTAETEIIVVVTLVEPSEIAYPDVINKLITFTLTFTGTKA